MLKKFIALSLLLNLMVLGPGIVSSQNYPNKTIRIITGGAGNVSDITSRLVAQGLSISLGQPVVVQNNASSIISAETAAKATPDGYTLFTGGNGLWIGTLVEKMPYDAVKDFAPITVASRATNVLTVHPALPVNSVKDLIAFGKANPGKLNYGSGIPGSSSHLAMELFKAMAGVDFVRVAYKGSGPAIIGLVGGEVQLMVPDAGAIAAHVKSGRLRALAVTSARASALYPELPTVAASGLPGYEMEVIIGMFAPAKTPEAIINRLNQECVRILGRPEIREKLLPVGIEPDGTPPAQLANAMKAEMNRLSKLIKDLHIRAE